MTRKTPVCPDRIRTVPEQFGWVDHRLVRLRLQRGQGKREGSGGERSRLREEESPCRS
jgi:hypothetical protein